ncbi:MAG: hypothetical protein FWF42_03700 [Streptococcaceae bacterium]|nr:hypothetical protein [Streptococcaceae bacterium]
MKKKSKIVKTAGVICIATVACSAIVWIGLSIAAPWETWMPDDSEEE